MRVLLFTIASLFAADTASASSIDAVKTGQDTTSSVSQLSCAQCPPPVVKKNTSYVVPDIAPGTEKVELKEINGEMKVVRTEAWLGGSPVVFISKASDDVIQAAKVRMLPAGQPENVASANSQPVEAQAAAAISIIDDTAKTSALASASMADMASVTPQDSRSQEVDLKSFQLRLK